MVSLRFTWFGLQLATGGLFLEQMRSWKMQVLCGVQMATGAMFLVKTCSWTNEHGNLVKAPCCLGTFAKEPILGTCSWKNDADDDGDDDGDVPTTIPSGKSPSP